MKPNLKKLQELELEDLIEFRDHGTMSNAPEEIVQYVQELDKVRRMDQRFDKYGSRDAIINHLMKLDGYTHYLACKIHDDAIEYFYGDRAISKKAWRNRISEKMMKAVNTGLALAKDSNEISRIIGKMKDIADILRLDEDDSTPVWEELRQKPIKLYSSNTEDLGLPKIDRYKLGKIIDELPEITDAQRQSIKRDAQLLPVKIFKDETDKS